MTIVPNAESEYVPRFSSADMRLRADRLYRADPRVEDDYVD
jgi:hypothetical protein